MENAEWLTDVEVDWGNYDKSKWDETYLPVEGEGTTQAEQISVAGSKLIYKWYNDGDSFDSTHFRGLNDLSSYANWLRSHLAGAADILDQVYNADTDGKYEQLLWKLSELIEKDIAKYANVPKVESVYKCSGPYAVETEDVDDWEDDYEDDIDLSDDEVEAMFED